MIPSNEEVGRRLRTLRGDRTLQEIADVCGVSRQAYFMYEQGERGPSDVVKKRIADYYHVSVSELFFTPEVNCK